MTLSIPLPHADMRTFSFILTVLCFAVSGLLYAQTPSTEQAAAVIKELEEKLAEAKRDIAELQRTLRAAANAKKTMEELKLSAPQDTGTGPEVDLIRAQSLSNVFREASKKVIPATVKVQGRSQRPTINIGPGVIQRNQPGLPTPPADSMGTGVIIDSKGIVLTNNHVVSSSRQVDVELADGRKFNVIDVKEDPRTDIAVLWLNSREPLPTAAFGDSDALDIGDWVLAIGNPFDLDSTVSAGIISAKGRTLKKVERGDFLQTDASINPGNSGGPLINLHGEIVGINTAIASATGSNQGIGFAIPSNSAKWITNQLITNGRVIRAYLGVDTTLITADMARDLGVGPRQGVVVTRVFEDTPGEKGGIKRDDVILAFNGIPVSTPEELDKLVERANVNEQHTLSMMRAKKKGEIKLSIDEMPVGFSPTKSLLGERAKPHNDGPIGLLVLEFTQEMASRYQIKADSGVMIMSVIPGSLADRAGLKQGMVVEQIDTVKIETTQDYIAARKRGPLSEGFDFHVVTPDGKKTIIIRNPKP
ncbi:MAG: trypsin-like peptidase domain-containing protein [Planctomycetaceae bacterium]|nr:trypsin-like peptidase domain-containing protein [Planctomycetaceae bacterium]